jgi:hypothetical protein
MRALVLLTLAFAPLPAVAQVLPVDHAGTWSGEGVQPEGDRWAMHLTLMPDGAVVVYPDIPCAAVWTYAEAGPAFLVATEHLAAGFELCVDDLPLRAQLDSKGTLTVTWTNPDGSHSATATLTRD